MNRISKPEGGTSAFTGIRPSLNTPTPIMSAIPSNTVIPNTNFLISNFSCFADGSPGDRFAAAVQVRRDRRSVASVAHREDGDSKVTRHISAGGSAHAECTNM